MNLARLNHVLVPPTKRERDRLRQSTLGLLLRPLTWLYSALSDEGRAIALVTLFVGTAAIEVGSTQVYVLWSMLVGLLAGALLVRPLFGLSGVQAHVAHPPRVAAGEPIRISVSLANLGSRDHHNIRVRGPFLPWDGRWLTHPAPVVTLAAGATVQTEARATFVQRGEHHLDVFQASALAPLGLSMGPGVESAGCHFIVVPAVAPVERVELGVGDRYQPGGVAQASRTGEAMELIGVRPYRRGDAIRDLHARTWARTGVPHVREYRQEYFTRIGVIVDNDGATTTEPGLEAGISLAAGVVFKLAQGEALIDLLVLGTNVHPLTIGRSLGFVDQALDLLACAEVGPALDADALLAQLDPHLGQLTAMVVITQRPPTPELAEPRRRLVEGIEARGVRCRLVEVVDEALPLKHVLASGSLRPAAAGNGPMADSVLTVGRIEEAIRNNLPLRV